MAYEKEFRVQEPAHNILLENRSKAAISGVKDVESFDENEVIISTTRGTLFVKGEDLRVGKLSLDTGDIVVEGLINNFEYEDEAKPSGGLFSRLFK